MDLKYLLTVDDQGTPTLKKFDGSIDKSAKKTKTAADKMAKSLKKTERIAKRVTLAIVAIGVAAAALSARKLIELADININLENRIKTVTSSSVELQSVFAKLADISNKTRSSFAATTELYVRTTAATKSLGISTEKMFEFISKLNKAVIVSGATTVEAENAIRQLTQGMSSGALRGEELRAVLEQLPVVAAAIEDQLGITRSELRKMGEDGKISASIIIESILNADKVMKDFENSTVTTEQAMTVFNNRLIVVGGNIGKKLNPVVAIFITAASNAIEKTGQWTSANDRLVKSGIVDFAKFFANALTLVLKVTISLVKIFNAFSAGIDLVQAGFAAMGQVATLVVKAILFGLGRIGEFLTFGILAVLKKVQQGFLIMAIGVANAGRVAATSQEEFNRMNERILDLKRELIEINKIEPDGANAFSAAMDEGVKSMDENIQLMQQFRTANENSALSAAGHAESLQALSDGVSKLNDEIQTNLDKELIKPPVKVETDEGGASAVAEQRLIKEQLAAQAAANAQVLIEKEKNAKIVESSKLLTQFISLENEVRFAAVEADAIKKAEAAAFLREEDKISTQEFEDIKTQILVASELEREQIKIDAAAREAERKALLSEKEIGDAATLQQTLFDQTAGGLFAKNAAWQQSENERLKIIAKAVAAEKTLEQKKAKGLQLGAAALGGALLQIAQNSGKKKFEQAKKIAIAEATINTISAAVTAFNTGGGYPVGLVLMLATLASGFAQVQNIKSTSVGGGGGGSGGGGAPSASVPSISGGGGGGLAIAPDLGPLTDSDLPGASSKQSLVVNIQGFVGDEAQLSSALAEIIQDATADGVDFGFTTSA